MLPLGDPRWFGVKCETCGRPLPLLQGRIIEKLASYARNMRTPEIAAHFGISQASAGNVTKMMAERGLIVRYRVGRSYVCFVNVPPTGDAGGTA